MYLCVSVYKKPTNRIEKFHLARKGAGVEKIVNYLANALRQICASAHLNPPSQSPAAATTAAAHLAKIKAKCVTKLPITYKTRKTVCARPPGRWHRLPPVFV